MGLGESQREIHIARDRAAAYAAVIAAAAAVGKVREASEELGTVTLRTRYGLQSVRLRISVIPDEHGCRVAIGSFADDVWGGGARRGTDKFVRALEAEIGAS